MHPSGLVLTHKVSCDAAGNVSMDSDAQMLGVFRPIVTELMVGPALFPWNEFLLSGSIVSQADRSLVASPPVP